MRSFRAAFAAGRIGAEGLILLGLLIGLGTRRFFISSLGLVGRFSCGCVGLEAIGGWLVRRRRILWLLDSLILCLAELPFLYIMQ